MKQLSILICSTHTRAFTFLPTIMQQVISQYNALSLEQQAQVEILILTDNKSIMLGEKRNTMVDIAKGKYIVFVDDDDRLSDDYIISLLQATETNADVITFKASVSINGGSPKICYYTKNIKADYNTANAYYRLPNHICCVKKEVSLKSSFPNIKYGEDSAYSKLLAPHLKTQHYIDKVLYYYDWNENTTETQEHIAASRLKLKPIDPLVDVVILSDSKSAYYINLCKQTIESCIKGANGLPVNIIVIEQQPNVKHANAITIYLSDKFNYNKFANIGAAKGSAEWIMIANNDLIFQDGWLHNLLAANYPVVSPKCPNDPRQVSVQENETGIINGRNLSGWCFMMKREVWSRIGGFDEEFNGWFADDATLQQCLKIGIEPMLVANSHVKHLGSQTLLKLPAKEREDLCWGKLERFNEKYNQTKFIDNQNFLAWKRK